MGLVSWLTGEKTRWSLGREVDRAYDRYMADKTPDNDRLYREAHRAWMQHLYPEIYK